MAIEKDPALLQEELKTTVTDPPVTEDEGESSAEAGEGSDTSGADGVSGEVTTEQKTESGGHDLVVAGDEPETVAKDTPGKAKERNREFARLRARNAELERKALEREQGAVSTVADPGKKPTLEDCGYETSEFEAKLDAWHEAKRLKETADAQAAQESQKAQGDRQQKQTSYLVAREAILEKLPDYEELESLVAAGLSQVQKDVILHYADSPEKACLVVAALGRNPERLASFAAIKDLGSLIKEMTKLEVRTELKSKTTTPPPERRISGSGSKTGAVDKELERLQAIADKTGDRTPVIRHIQEKKRKQQG